MHIVEVIGKMVKLGEFVLCEFIIVELEFVVMSVAIGLSAVGVCMYIVILS